MTWRSSKFFIVAVSAIAIFVDSLAYSIIIPLLPTFQRELLLSDVEVGVLTGIFAFCQMFGSLLFGWLIDRFEKNTRHTLFGGLFFLALATLLFAIGRSYWVLCLARSLQGFAASASWSAAMALIPRNLVESERGRATAFVMSCSGLGSIAGPVVCGLLVEAGGRAMPFYCLTSVIALDAIARLLLVEKPFVAASSSLSATTTTAKLTLMQSYRVLLIDVEVVTLLAFNFANAFIFMGMEPLFPLLVADKFKYDVLGVGLVYAAYPLAFVAVSPLAGWLVDARAHWRPTMLTCGLLAGALFLLPCELAPNVALVVVFSIAVGGSIAFVSTPVLPLCNTVVERNYGGRLFASANALTNVVWSLGAFVGPIAFTAIADLSFRAAWVTASMIGAGFALCFLVATRCNAKLGTWYQRPPPVVASIVESGDVDVAPLIDKTVINDDAIDDEAPLQDVSLADSDVVVEPKPHDLRTDAAAWRREGDDVMYSVFDSRRREARK